jgi:outer membrane lipoprotein SlyB
MSKRFSFLAIALLLACSLLGSGLLTLAQQRRNDNSHFYDGASRGVRGGNYGYDRGRHYQNNNNNQGGIGPGKGALIGGAAGAVLGAAFGGGVKGSLITGAAGAGIGAVIGQAAQNNRNNNNYYRR